MTDRPIIFSGAMVRALLDGRKTQTRRITKQQPAPPDNVIMPLAWWTRFAPGDRIWVREASAVRYQGWHHKDGHTHGICYRADENNSGQYIGHQHNACGGGIRKGEAPSVFPRRSHNVDGRLRWASSIHMPRWASRLTLTVTDVRVERLQDISEGDARAEGVQALEGQFEGCFAVPGAAAMSGVSARSCFERLWNSLHGPDAWSANPWVAAISFSVERRNIDAAPR